MSKRIAPPGYAALIVVGAVLCVTAALVTATGTATGSVWLESLARALSVAAPLAVGLYALRRPPFQRFGVLLMMAGVGWFLTTLSNSDNELLYSLGRLAGWTVEPLLLYLLLTFPSGRLEGRIDRLLVATMVVVVGTLYLPTALLTDAYPVPGPWMSCASACPDNAFMVVDAQPAFIDDFVRPLRELITIALFFAVAVRLAQRIHGSTRLVRRTVAPVLAVACLRSAVYGGAVLVRYFAPESTLADVWLWLLAFMVPLMALSFLVGLARWSVFIGRSTRRLAASLLGDPGPDEVRRALAEAFDDPSLEIVYSLEDGAWIDAGGRPLGEPAATRARCVTEIHDGDRRIAAIVHDRALRNDRGFVDTATAFTSMTLNHHARIRAAATEERLRIERDLHDGAQQRLVALAINLGIAAEQTNDDDHEHASAVMRRLAVEVERALEELRSLTHGEVPPPLADLGLVGALRAAATRNPLPTTVMAVGLRRYSPEIERAVYFSCLEALQNAIKHARGATAVLIDVSDAGGLRMEVRDDGAGFDRDTVTCGLGFTSMRERLATVGGSLTIVSSPGHGTRVIARVPLSGGVDGATAAPSRSGAAPPG